MIIRLVRTSNFKCIFFVYIPIPYLHARAILFASRGLSCPHSPILAHVHNQDSPMKNGGEFANPDSCTEDTDCAFTILPILHQK